MSWATHASGAGLLGALGLQIEFSIYLACGVVCLSRTLPRWRSEIQVLVASVWLLFTFGSAGTHFLILAALPWVLTRFTKLKLSRHFIFIFVWFGALWLHAQFTSESFLTSMLYSGFWVSMFYPSLILLQIKEPLAFTDSLAAQLFIVKWAQPYFQPISPQAILASITPRQSLMSFVGALWLFVWGKLCLSAGPLVTSSPSTPFALGVVQLIFKTYAFGAGQLFVSIGLARAMGFNLDRGTHFPFLAKSFSDVYRRWNTYVREAVLTLVVRPYYERFGPPKSRIGNMMLRFGAIVLGSYVLNHLLVPQASGQQFSNISFARLYDSYLPLMLIVWFFTAIEPQSSRKTPTRAYHARFFITVVLAFAVMHWFELQAK
jgi:hypothetical protein